MALLDLFSTALFISLASITRSSDIQIQSVRSHSEVNCTQTKEPLSTSLPLSSFRLTEIATKSSVLLLAPLLDGGLRGGDPRDGHAVRGARDVVQARLWVGG